MSPRLPASAARAFALILPALGLAGCASPGLEDAGSSAATSVRAWHDPGFYEEWHDPAAVVLPPPPFTGFAADGQTAPMLPVRLRPASGERP